ncbi:Uncharacterized protein ALO68_03889 [Pseudomonas syringae pv. helianthi]|uniref:Uncharacterized protein n=1 Tax=Pseudomonas syringae pv. helianthi TaxID=251654 RepID=A0A0P9SP57_9PSED|nr:hypothetical protein [Pseudomonas syringae group genomosp. 7]KPX44843.1 Uncharacterized protein ALO68_03889 [Pseudomonas syringae pv. helianthi]UNB61883.1 hypothetical protein MME54_19935 [Pseudomonas syringae pv. helianthi]
MSKHPIPDWLRSQFSRIEDEVQKLGPCGVFTQMRTVTQTYFEQAAAAPQPPALGGEPVVIGTLHRDCDERIVFESSGEIHIKDGMPVYDDTHLAPLQAEIERLNAESERQLFSIQTLIADRDAEKAMKGKAREQRDQLKAELADRWEQISELNSEIVGLKARCDELEHRAADVVEGFDGEELPGAMTMRIRKLKAVLSEPAGSEQV